jgi:integrase/recombinase XerC/integrase/recombinase XerD
MSNSGEAHPSESLRLFLASRRAESTRRSYTQALESLQRALGADLLSATKMDVARWLDTLRQAGLSAATVRQRQAAASAYYRYAMRLGLAQANPADAVERTADNPFGKATALDAAQSAALIRAIPTHTLPGLRDRALIACYLLTGRRNSEIRCLHWGDIRRTGSQVEYQWHGKGKSRWDILPADAWQAVEVYLQRSNRLDTLRPDDWLFVAHSDAGARLGHETAGGPISMASVNVRLRMYARDAGLDPEGISVHSLRHTAAMLYKRAGADVIEVQRLLNHTSLSNTALYLQHLERREPRQAATVAAWLGL